MSHKKMHTTKPCNHPIPAGASNKPPRSTQTSKQAYISPARLAAHRILCKVRERHAFAQRLIHADQKLLALSCTDRSFATKLILGVVATSGTLDELIERTLYKPSNLTPVVRDALRMSTYEIIFLKKAPHAAVDQGVELVRFVQARAVGLANAVLRKIVLLRDQFPFGDLCNDGEALARFFGFPLWLANKLVCDQGYSEASRFMQASNEQAPLYLALNALHSVERIKQRLVSAGALFEEVIFDGQVQKHCIRLVDSSALMLPAVSHMIGEGDILVCDASSHYIASAVLPTFKPASFLEVGAGRATKTILIQSGAYAKWGSQIEKYVALDKHDFKANIIQDRTRAYGVRLSSTLSFCIQDFAQKSDTEGFEVVFLDAPCSGLGTLRRHPEIRWRLKQSDINQFAQTQLTMLRACAKLVISQGRLFYATCTVTPEENEGVVKAFLSSPEGKPFRQVKLGMHRVYAACLHTHSPDAHFGAAFTRD